ncbi:MAG: ABC transporter substrate-binding protein [Firmicutes bacterium]|nr:ABC transporter substrate-binding protein [Bacillota bacterium]
MLKNLKKRKSILLVLSLLLTLSLLACNQEAAVNNEAGDKVEYAQGITEDTIKIGTIAVQSGVLSFIGTPYVAGMESYFNMINENGGVNGRKIELLKKDDEFKPDKAVAAVESLIYDDEVFAIVGQLGTPGVVAAQDIVKEKGIPSVYFGSGAVSLTKAGENFFPVQPNYVYEGKLMSKYAFEEFKADKVVVMYQNDDVGRDGLEGFKDGLKELDKSSMLPSEGEIAFGASDTDFTVQIQKAKEQDPDLIIIYGLGGATSGILKGMEGLGVNKPMLTTYSNADASFLKMASKGAPNVIENLNVMGWLEVNGESLKPLNEAMKKYYPDVPVNAYTMAGWVAGETFVAGVKKAGDNLTWDGYIKAMNNLKFTEGLAPEISYEPGVRQGVTKMAVSKVVKNNGQYEFKVKTAFKEFE